MNNFQNLYALISETHIFTAVSLGVFAVFLWGISSPLLYLAVSKSAFLFDSSQISAYLDKTTMPEPIRLKILFLSFPSYEKGILSDYLKTPTTKPSKLFSSTLEQLKCEILEKVNYNKNVAVFFFIISACTIFAWGVHDLETKILACFSVAFTLFCIDLICNGIYSGVKYASYLQFKKAVSRLDDFHNIYNNKFACGLFGTQSPNSPCVKTANISPKPLHTKDFLEKTKQTEIKETIKPIDPPRMAVLNFDKKPTPTEGAITLEKPQDNNPKSEVSQLLCEIKRATETFNFDAFQTLSNRLTEITTSQTLTSAEHQELQNWLDECLKEFRLVGNR